MSQLQTVSDNLETHSWRILTMWQFEQLLYFSCPDRVCQRDQCETLSLTHFWFWNTQRDPRHLWTFGHLLRVMRKHDLTNKKTKTKTKTMTMKITTTFREHLQRAISETFDLWLKGFEAFHHSDEKTWPEQQKDNDKDNNKDNDKYIYSLQTAIFETFDLWDIWSEWWEKMT